MRRPLKVTDHPNRDPQEHTVGNTISSSDDKSLPESYSTRPIRASRSRKILSGMKLATKIGAFLLER